MVNEIIFERLGKIHSLIKLSMISSDEQAHEYLYRIKDLVDEIYMLLEE